MTRLSQSAEDYLKAIYKLQRGREAVGRVTTSLIAERMEVSAASATNMIKKLADMKLLRHTPYRGVELTRTGEKLALHTVRHHRLLELYLAEALGFAWDQVHAEADRLEHAISEEFEDRIDQVLGHPTTGTHGEPIPTKQGTIAEPTYPRLAELKIGQPAVIRQVSDRSAELLRYLDELGLHLGTRLEIREKAPFQGPLQLLVDGERELHLGPEVAEQIFVEPVELS